jgi:IMP dehydrogenase
VNHKVHLSFKDVLLVPFDEDFCQIESRNNPDISVCLGDNKKIKIPILSSPMDSITGPEMAIALNKAGALGVLTRYINKTDSEKEINEARQINDVITVRKAIEQNGLNNIIATAIGVRTDVEELAKKLVDNGANVLCIDIANGNHVFVQKTLSKIVKLKESYNNLTVIAGNVATGKAAIRLFEHGADVVKIGIGSGAACSTRRIVGFGCPQFTAVLDCAEARDKKNYQNLKFISDGGIRYPGDAVKALWAGADFVMMGYVFAGHDESPKIDGKTVYRGMSSRNVSGRTDIAAEGVSFAVSCNGPVERTVSDWAASIRAGLSMANANNIIELRRNVTAIRVSTMSNEESDPIHSGE